MLSIKIIATGEFKENYLKEAAAEYKKRLGAWCKVEEYIFREEKLPENPSPSQIAEALKTEEKIILSKIPGKAYVIAMCVEGKQLSSEELADKIEQAQLSAKSELVFIIGSSYGLSQRVKNRCDLKLSFSRLTFPHQLMRVILYEAIYRSFTIIACKRYHK
jgi:23S rRNA (pseudouridine1915-N3)-methyltransferase